VQVEVRILDRDTSEALVAYLREQGCVVDESGLDLLHVNPLGSTRAELAASELADQLQTWLIRHPGSAVALDARR